MSFPTYKCFRTFAVWKHFSIYPYPQIGSHYLTANSNIFSASSLATSPWKKSSRSACPNGQTSVCCVVPPTALTSSCVATLLSNRPSFLSAKSRLPFVPWTSSAIFLRLPSASRTSARHKLSTRTSRKCHSRHSSPATTINEKISFVVCNVYCTFAFIE